MGFNERIQQAVLLFRERVSHGPVLVVGNLDADGITATSLIVRALMREHISFAVNIIKQINDSYLDELSSSPYGTIFFVDLGSGYISGIEQKLTGKHVFILDHHYPEKWEVHQSIMHVNPHLDDIDGTKEISAAGVCYFFARQLNVQNLDMAHLALIGAVGDIQENNGFIGLNREILKDALDNNLIEVKDGLRMYGIYTRPLSRVLEYSTNPYIPGVTGNRAGALKFIEEHGIARKGKSETIRLNDLNQDDVDKLLNALHMKVQNNLLGPVYLLRKMNDIPALRDLREFSTLLNACGRMGKASLGVGVCLEDKESIAQAFKILEEYRHEILQGLEWFYKHRGTECVIEGKGFTIIRADAEIRDTIIGTLASLISKSNVYPDNTIIMSMARTLGDEIKISMRISGFGKSAIDLRKIVKEIINKTGGYGGGHRLAAGATIPQDKEDKLISIATETLSRGVVEEQLINN